MPRQVFIFIFFIILFVLFHKSAFAANLLLNPSFEDGLSSWTLNGTTATFSAVSDPKHSGDNAVKLSKETASSWAYFYQRLPIESRKYYKLSGWLRLNDNFITNGKLRFYWLSDSSGTKVVSDPIEVTLTSKSSDFQFIQTDSVISPDQSVFAEVQGYVYLNQKSPVVPLLFDDLVFENSQPTPTPTNIPTPTNTPTSTSAPTPTPTKTPTPSPTKSPTPTLKPTSALVTPTSIEPTYEVIPTSVLGESTKSEIRGDEASKITPVEEAKVLGIQTNNFSKILISIGVILLACGILFFRTYILNKKDGE